MEDEIIVLKPVTIKTQSIEVVKLLERSNIIVIENAVDAENGSFLRAELKKMEKAVKGEQDSYTDPLKEVMDKIKNNYKNPLAMLKAAWEKIDEKLLAYRKAEQKRVDDANKERQMLIDIQVATEKAELKKKADDMRREAELLQKKLEEEITAREEEKKKHETELNKGTDAILERKRLREEAVESKKREDEQRARIKQLEEEAEKAKNTKIITEEPPLQKVHKIMGVAVKTSWKYRVIDISMVEMEYLIVNDSLVSEIARKSKGKAVISGIEFYDEEYFAGAKV
ncbi:MAG: hypothetical protein WC616_01475 [Candidatus Omnitrophota bacterium]